MPYLSKYFRLFSLPVILGISNLASAAPIIDQTNNLLANGSFESGLFDTVVGHSVASAANNWRQWSNSGGTIETELVTEAEMQSLYGVDLIDGNSGIRIKTESSWEGGFTFNSYGHDYWNVYGDVTFSGWVYVISGSMGFNIGSNLTGFVEEATSSIGQWEFVTVSNTSGHLNNEPLLYSARNSGAAEFIVDSVWLNQGLNSEHPTQSLVAVPTPATFPLSLLALVALYLPRFARKRASFPL